jgi:ParB/RepB/Spo0J family partition protein
MAKFKVKKIANVAVNNDIVVSEVNQIVANEIVNNEVNTDIPEVVDSDIVVNSEVVVDSDIPESEVDSEIDSEVDSEVVDFSTPPIQEQRNYVMISLSDITIDRAANRKAGMDDKSIMEFAKVLRRDKGVNSPIQVYHDIKSGKYKVISGHRRYLASVMAGFSEIPAMIVKDQLSKDDIFKLRTGENLDRVDLSLIDIAEAMDYSITVLNWTKKYTAEWFSLKSHRRYIGSDVTKIVTLLQLPEIQKSFLIDGSMHVSTAYKWLRTNHKNPVAANNATDALEALEEHIKNMSQSRARKLADIVISKASGDEPEAEEVLNSNSNSEVETPESNDSVINDSVIPESRIDPSLRLTPEDCFPDNGDEPTPVSSRRSSPNDIQPPTSQNQDSNNESNSEVERLLADAAKSERNKEMSRERIIRMLMDIEEGTSGFPVCGIFEIILSAINGHNESITEVIVLCKEFVLAPIAKEPEPKKGANKKK